jgi:hypothetical protein
MWVTAPDCDRTTELPPSDTVAHQCGGAHLPRLQSPDGARRSQTRWHTDVVRLIDPHYDRHGEGSMACAAQHEG